LQKLAVAGAAEEDRGNDKRPAKKRTRRGPLK